MPMAFMLMGVFKDTVLWLFSLLLQLFNTILKHRFYYYVMKLVNPNQHRGEMFCLHSCTWLTVVHKAIALFCCVVSLSQTPVYQTADR